MSAEELMKRIIAQGADEEGILDRFGTNSDLYAQCFREFLKEPNLTVLKNAMASKDYKTAFEAAHALKGISGNLGLTAFYEAICVLVESLRADNYSNVASEYAAVLERYRVLSEILYEKPHKSSDENKPDMSVSHVKPKDKRLSRHMIVAVCLTLAVIGFIVFFIVRINIDYHNNILKESGQHLTKTSNQIRLYMDEHIAYSWKLTESLMDSISDVRRFQSDSEIIELLERRHQIWGVSNLMLYTEDGYCTDCDGETVKNDIASEIISKARMNGRWLSVIDSSLVYTVPIDTDVCYKGSRIVAISVIRDMSVFLDEMNFTYYDSSAMMYLTMENGIIISRLSHPDTSTAFNLSMITDGKNIQPLNSDSDDNELYTSDDVEAFLMTGSDEQQYIMSIPIDTGSIPLRVFYVESESVVNNSTNSFSGQLVVFSVVIIIMFSITMFATFILIYKNRKKTFDKALKARDRMLDLMIKNTKTAFALFDADKNEPDYYSGNTIDIVGDTYWNLYRTDSGYGVRNNTDTATGTVKTANEMLRDWDGKSPFRSGYIRYGQDIHPLYFVFQLYPVDDSGKEFVGIAQDVTAVYEREAAVKDAMDMAKRANEAKSRFLSNMSHDIRTPMNAIMNMSNFSLESIDQPKKLAVYLHTIHESAEHLLQLVNDVLDISRIESGQTVIASENFDIKDEVQKQVEMIKPLCDEKNLKLIVNTDGIKNTSLRGDSLKLSQIVMNLLSNAVKFTMEKGAIRLTVSEIASLSSDMVDVRIKVEDTGIGISEENLKYIFEPFNRADDERVSRIEGTGLGLSICKNYAEAMGGSIRCESEEGEGTTFTVELFFNKSDYAKKPDFPAEKPNQMMFLGMHCLVVEDNETNQLIAKELLERIGFIVEFADNGSDGVTRFVQSNADTYDVIYMDIQMPVMNGYRAAEAIRASAHPRAKTVPIIAMTANAFAEDIEKARISGMNAYIAKPIVSSDLIDQTTDAIRKQRGTLI